MQPKTCLATPLAVVLSILALSGPALALDPRKSIGEYHHQSWQTEQGLPQNTVYAIAQTADGYLWFATIGGLARFDGVRFTTFKEAALSETEVWDLSLIHI